MCRSGVIRPAWIFFFSAMCLAVCGAAPASAGVPGVSATALDCADPRTPIDAQHTPGDADALFVIRQPGSYYLPKSLQGTSGKSGIEIAASHVTIDLRGMSIVGGPGALAGMRARAGQTNITVRDGVVRDWPGAGVDLSDALLSTVEDVRAFSNDSGIVLANRCIVRRCIAADNAGGGILTGQGSTVQDCVAAFNGANGIYVLEASRIGDCTLEGNNGHGIYLDGDGCAVSNCVTLANTLNGLSSIYGAAVTQVTAEDNGRDGLWSLGSVTYTECRVTLNVQDGIDAGDDSAIVGCVALSNGQDGFRLAQRVSIRDCRASDHRKGAGIHGLGVQVKIDGNHLLGNGVGVRVAGAGGVIVRNMVTGSLSQAFDIVPGNAFGPVVNVGGAGDVAGIAGAGHPLANLCH